MGITTKNIKAIDNHWHVFDHDHERPFFEQHFSLSTLPVSKEDIRNTLFYRMVYKELKRYFDMPNATMDEIAAERQKRYAADPMYVDKLFQDAGISAVLCDIGFPNPEFSGYSVDYDERASKIPNTEIRKMVRIEPLIYTLLNDGTAREYPAYREAFKAFLKENIEKEQAVAVKTVIAYRTGLNIHKESDDVIADAYKKYSADIKDQASNKIFRDDMVYAAMEVCEELDLPMQIHTGTGDYPALDLRRANPLELHELIKAFPNVKIIVVHCGYPYIAETGTMINQFPNVYVDLSEMVPYASIGAERALFTILEMGPVNKIMFGSDSNFVPEVGWFAAIYFRKCLEKVLNGLIEDGVVDEDYAMEMAEMILHQNAERIYKL